MTLLASSPRVVFVVTSPGNDVYSAMTRIAVASLRISNPRVTVTCVSDSESDQRMRHSADPLISEVDQWIAMDTPPGDAGYRNRYLKTTLRRALTGPFLFLDSDTFIRGDLEQIFTLDCDVAASPNHSREQFEEQIWAQDQAKLDEMHWKVGHSPYLNGGVMLLNDTGKAHSFADEWHRRWMISSSNGTYYRDQPALNSAIHAVQPNLCVLPDRFNAQILISPEVAVDAVVWHYYSSVKRDAATKYHGLVQDVLENGWIDIDKIRDQVACRHPWIADALIDVWSEVTALRKESVNARRELEGARRDLECARHDLESVLASKSWTLTKPLRALDDLRRQLNGGRPETKGRLPES